MRILDDRRFGDLQADGRVRQALRLGQQPIGEDGVGHQPSGQVHIDRQGIAEGRQPGLVGDRLLHHPAGDLHDGAGLLGEADEAVGGHQAVFGMAPSDQRLDGIDAAGPGSVFRLIVEEQLVSRERPVQVAHQLQAGGHVAPFLHAESGDLGVAGLGPGQGHGGVLDDGVFAWMDLGVADDHVDIDALVLDL